MKRFIAVFLAFSMLLPLGFRAQAQAADVPETSAGAFVLYCPDNGEVLLSDNADKRMKPASTTKLMTALITLERAAAHDETITFTDEMTAEGSSMYLGLGERVKLSDLAVGMMMCSGNDAANAAAVSIAGSAEGFSRLMNERARELGMTRTHFVTPSGLDDPDHYTTAYDMALLMAAALENKAFASLTARRSCPVDFVAPADKHVTYSNHNRLLSLYPDCIGGKTGYTTAAGRCLVSAARRDGLTLICVTLDDGDDWNDHIKLCDYGFERYGRFFGDDSDFAVSVPCVGGEADSVRVVADSAGGVVLDRAKGELLRRRVMLDSFLYAPVKKGDRVGRIVYYLGGKETGAVDLIADNSVNEIKIKKSFFERIKEFFSHG